jgi:serine O-acetyltransferase|tara:strand:- start:9060 stop:10505 length:1446 start_codon:yes stop_codon:yes gene_type:complete
MLLYIRSCFRVNEAFSSRQKHLPKSCFFAQKEIHEKKFVILLLHTDKRLCVVSLSSLSFSSSSSLEKAIYLSCSFSPLEAMMMMMRARSSFGCSTSSSSFSLPFLTTAKNRMGLKRFNNNNKKNNNNNNKSSVVSIRAGKKKSSSSSFEQLPELTEDETAKKWAGESNDSPTIVSKKESGRGDATNPTTSSTRKLRKKEDAIEQDVLEGEACLLGDGIWEKLCEEAKMEIELEPALASYLYSTILSHKEMSDALAFVLANKLGSSVLLDSQLLELFSKCYREDPELVQCAIADMQAVLERDPACDKYVMILLYFKGFQALQAQRIAHSLWSKGRQSLALLLQHRVSEAFHVDAHPAAKIGKGVMIDHATGVVIGETAVVGNNVSILHNVTLGGTGTTDGDRHPKIGDGVVLGAGATILGPVIVGTNVKIGAGSVVLQDIPDNSVAVGIPAKILRRERSEEVIEPSLSMDQTDFLEGWDFTI